MMSSGELRTISPSYQRMNLEMHSEKPSYGTSGKTWAKAVSTLCTHRKYNTILDYGCGKMTLSKELQKLNPRILVTGYDPAIPGKDQKKFCDLVVCTDVLEHVEPEYLDAVLDDLTVWGKELYTVIHCGPALKMLPDGRNAHLIQERYQWWLNKLIPRFQLEEVAVRRVDGKWSHTELTALAIPLSLAGDK